MAIWPFGRKSRKNTNPSKIDEKDMAPAKGKTSGPTGRETVQSSGNNASNQDGNQPRKRSSSRKLSKVQLSRIRDEPKAEPMPPRITPGTALQYANNEKENFVPMAKSAQQYEKPPAHRDDVPSYYFQNQNTLSQSSLQPEKFSVIPQAPTLRAKRSSNDTSTLPRRKSNRRTAEEKVREQEVKAMSSPIPLPKRPASHSSGLLARDNKKIPGGLNRKFERPTSEVSLPIPESMHSSISGATDMHGFKISAFDALSPRPTIRYQENPRYVGGPSSLNASRASTRKEKRSTIPEEGLQTKERIDDLVDDMDAGSLRELMERDQRRREKKRQSDQEKLQRRLQRKAEKQKGTESPGQQELSDYDKAIQATKDRIIGLGVGGSTDALRTNRFKDDVPKSPASWLRDSSRENVASEDPFQDPKPGFGSTTHFDDATPTDEREELPKIETAKVVRLSQASMSPPSSPSRFNHARGPSNLSTVDNLATTSNLDFTEDSEPNDARRDSDTSGRVAGSWTSIFRRSGTRGNRGSGDRGRAAALPPSDFSNTSRESFIARQNFPQPPQPPYARVHRERSGTPARTQSRFREDLPELPASPTDSRVQSPDTERLSPLPGSSATAVVPGTSVGSPDPSRPLSDIHPAFRDEVALSRHASVKDREREATPEGPSPALLSQSLASVDSEGSWLSGRPTKRSSQQAINPLRESAGSLNRLENLGSSTEDVGMASDAYFNRTTPAPEGGAAPTEGVPVRAVGEADTESLAESLQPPPPAPDPRIGGEARYHSAVGRRPTIIKHGLRAKSREGLLNEFQAGEESPSESSPTNDSPSAEASSAAAPNPNRTSVHRAMSVDLGSKGHARHISAGSARLLNLPQRASGEQKRLSVASGERSPLGAPSPSEETESQSHL
ncbi:hypothetical protein MMC09_000654 [Bachmanniomyces sp. S44760]|nr:hypothetical protein [Bachmanniomyces sp. S44760]